jgi:hypothetical protein
MCDELYRDHFHYDSCEPYSWKDYMFVVKVSRINMATAWYRCISSRKREPSPQQDAGFMNEGNLGIHGAE